MKKVFNFILKLCLGFFIITILFVVIYKWVPVPITPLMVIRYFEADDTKATVFEHDWVPIDSISTNMQLAVISSEDQKFLVHNGFDFEAIEKALENNEKGKRLKGGSTISQQVAKNVFLWPKRSWLRKGLEAYFTGLIELIWSKKRIMEVYLNSIEMGPGIYGIEAASYYWFNKSASELTKNQSAAIAAIIPGPLIYKASPATRYIQAKKRWILRNMKYFEPLDYK